MIASAGKKEHLFKEHPLVAASYMKTAVFGSLFSSQFCVNFSGTYFEEHRRTAASENVLWNWEKLKF